MRFGNSISLKTFFGQNYFFIPTTLWGQMTTKEIPKKQILIYTDEVKVSNTDHTKMIKQNFRLFYQNFRKQITMSPYYWAMLLQNSTFSQTVTANKHQFSPSYTVCKRLLVLLSKMCFCLRLYGKRDRLPINYFTGLTCSFNPFVQGKF